MTTRNELQRSVGALHLTAMGVGAVIGTGIFVVVGGWFRFGIWLALGVLIYVVYGYRNSRLRRAAVPEAGADAPRRTDEDPAP